MCDDPQMIPLPPRVCAVPRVAALIRQMLAHAPHMRPSAPAALEEAESIWREFVDGRRAARASDGRGEGEVEWEVEWEEDWKEAEAAGRRLEAGYIGRRLFGRWAQVCVCLSVCVCVGGWVGVCVCVPVLKYHLPYRV